MPLQTNVDGSGNVAPPPLPPAPPPPAAAPPLPAAPALPPIGPAPPEPAAAPPVAAPPVVVGTPPLPAVTAEPPLLGCRLSRSHDRRGHLPALPAVPAPSCRCWCRTRRARRRAPRETAERELFSASMDPLMAGVTAGLRRIDQGCHKRPEPATKRDAWRQRGGGAAGPCDYWLRRRRHAHDPKLSP